MRVLLFGASGGIGSALAAELAGRGADVTGLSRSGDGLDVTDDASVVGALQHLERPFDLIFDATGALEIGGQGPEKTIDAIEPALLLKHAHRLLAAGGIFATLSARVGSIGDNRLGGWISYRASKAALNQIVRTASIEIARKMPDAIVVALHSGTVETALTRDYVGRHPAVPAAEAARNLLSVLEALTPGDTGGVFAWDGRPVPW